MDIEVEKQWLGLKTGELAKVHKRINEPLGSYPVLTENWSLLSWESEPGRNLVLGISDSVTGDGSKVRYCKEQHCIGTWNVRSMNQGKLEVVKQEMARVNMDVLGISELKQTGMGELNSDEHYIYYCGQESLRRNGVATIVNKSLKCSIWMQSQKQWNDLCSFPRQTIQYYSNPSLYPNQ